MKRIIILLITIVLVIGTLWSDPVVYEGIGVFELIDNQASLTDGWYIITNRINNTNAIPNRAMGISTVGAGTSEEGLSAIPLVHDYYMSKRRIINPVESIVWHFQSNGDGRFTIREFAGTKRFVTWRTNQELALVEVPPVIARSEWRFLYLDPSSAFEVDVTD